MSKLKNNEILEKEKLSRLKDQYYQDIENQKEKLVVLKKQRDALKDDIDHKLKSRTQHTKLVKKAEDEEHNIDEEIVNLLNKLKKIEN